MSDFFFKIIKYSDISLVPTAYRIIKNLNTCTYKHLMIERLWNKVVNWFIFLILLKRRYIFALNTIFFTTTDVFIDLFVNVSL